MFHIPSTCGIISTTDVCGTDPSVESPRRSTGEAYMPFYIRKAVTVGPFRFNLSKSGVGLSAGVKGFRVGTGPRGNYIHMGRGGLYYRQSLPGGQSTHDSQNIRSETSHVELQALNNLSVVETGNVLNMTDSNAQDVIKQINEKLSTISFWPFICFSGLCAIFLLNNYFPENQILYLVCGVFTIVFSLIVSRYDQTRKTVVLMYDLDNESTHAFKNLTEEFDKFISVSKKWNIEAKGDIQDWKRNAGASTLVKRISAVFSYKAPRVIKSNVGTPAIIGGKQSLYFFPDILLVIEGRKAGAINYNKLKIDVDYMSFVEEESVPPDAEVISHTWKYVNKNGGPDRRFNNNREIPIMQYQTLYFSSGTGLSKLLHLSKCQDRSEFVRAVAKVGKLVAEQLATFAANPRPDQDNETTKPQPKLLEQNTRQSQIDSRHARSSRKPLIIATGVVLGGVAALLLYPVKLSENEPIEREDENRPEIVSPRDGPPYSASPTKTTPGPTKDFVHQAQPDDAARASGTQTSSVRTLQPTGNEAAADSTGSNSIQIEGSSQDMVRRIQTLLGHLGYNPGVVDGIYGPRTRKAILAFQSDTGLKQDGFVNRMLFVKLKIAKNLREAQ